MSLVNVSSSPPRCFDDSYEVKKIQATRPSAFKNRGAAERVAQGADTGSFNGAQPTAGEKSVSDAYRVDYLPGVPFPC
jgi:hypothetical protein